MSDDDEMRFRLQVVLAYRQVRAAVKAGATATLINAILWLGLTAFLFAALGPHPLVFVYFALGFAELCVGIWKKVSPSVEALLADGIILLGFGGFALGRQILAWQGIIAMPVSPISIMLGVWWLHEAVKAFRAYGELRRLFPTRPSADQIAWFDELIYDIRHADPAADATILDLRTKPAWMAQLLGTTAFFVAARGPDVVIAGPGDFDLRREKTDHGTGRRKARFRLFSSDFPDFEIDDASWDNYQKWIDANPGPTP